jgi:hypothetical protein
MVIIRNQTWDVFGNLLKEEIFEVPNTHTPLDSIGVMATLNAVLGVWSLADAANAVGLTQQDLIAEAQAWAVGQSFSGTI